MILSLSLIFHFLAVYLDIYWFLSRERLVVLFRSEDSDLSLILKHSQLWSLLPVTSCPDSCLFYFSETPIKHILEFFTLSCISVNTCFLHRFFFFLHLFMWLMCVLVFVHLDIYSISASRSCNDFQGRPRPMAFRWYFFCFEFRTVSFMLNYSCPHFPPYRFCILSHFILSCNSLIHSSARLLWNLSSELFTQLFFFSPSIFLINT